MVDGSGGGGGGGGRRWWRTETETKRGSERQRDAWCSLSFYILLKHSTVSDWRYSDVSLGLFANSECLTARWALVCKVLRPRLPFLSYLTALWANT